MLPSPAATSLSDDSTFIDNDIAITLTTTQATENNS